MGFDCSLWGWDLQLARAHLVRWSAGPLGCVWSVSVWIWVIGLFGYDYGWVWDWSCGTDVIDDSSIGKSKTSSFGYWDHGEIYVYSLGPGRCLSILFTECDGRTIHLDLGIRLRTTPDTHSSTQNHSATSSPSGLKPIKISTGRPLPPVSTRSNNIYMDMGLGVRTVNNKGTMGITQADRVRTR